jgi:hypothetical protein
MTGERKLTEPLTEEDRARLFNRIHRSPRIPDRYAVSAQERGLPILSVIPAKAGFH